MQYKLNETIEIGEAGQEYLLKLTQVINEAVYEKLEPELQTLAGKISIARIQKILADNGVTLNLMDIQQLLHANQAVIENGFIKLWKMISGYHFSQPWKKWAFRIGLLLLGFILAYLMGAPFNVLDWLNKAN